MMKPKPLSFGDIHGFEVNGLRPRAFSVLRTCSFARRGLEATGRFEHASQEAPTRDSVTCKPAIAVLAPLVCGYYTV